MIVYQLPELVEVHRAAATGPLRFPYVPGLLAFREAPVLLAAFEKLVTEPDVLIFDGQGLAHPRRFGIACHMGLLLDRPSIGCAKSRLCGEHAEPAERAGAAAPLMDGGRQVGAVVRTRDRVKPVFVSIGHRVDLETAVTITLRCVDGYRVPKPTREADRFVAELKKPRSDAPRQRSLFDPA